MMGSKRALLSPHNTLLEPEHTPSQDVLISRRRLGQTDLTQSGVRGETVGIFDYAHLRVPLPKDLKGSGIFHPSPKGSYPESYFLMRRSSDGYISATGMFKAAFPWASSEEEHAERQFHKKIPSAGSQEVAGNVWIAPNDALELAQEYSMRPWIIALLSTEPIEASKDKLTGEIATPPRYVVPEKDRIPPTPVLAPSTARARSLRSMSPSKSAASPRKIASPRKRAGRNASAKSDAKKDAEKASRGLQETIDQDPSLNVKSTPVAKRKDDVVSVAVDHVVEKVDDVETRKTGVTVEYPATYAAAVKSSDEMVATAKQMVEEARKLEADKEAANRSRSKRKVDDMELEHGDRENKDKGGEPATKRIKSNLEEQLLQERTKSRALIGLTATLAIGAIIPYFL